MFTSVRSRVLVIIVIFIALVLLSQAINYFSGIQVKKSISLLSSTQVIARISTEMALSEESLLNNHSSTSENIVLS